MTRLIAALGMLLALCVAPPLAAQADLDAAFRQRADELPKVLAGRAELADYFTASFLAEIPAARFTGLTQELVRQNGPVLKVDAIVPEAPGNGVVRIGYERAIVTVRLAVESAAPHRVTGLLITGSETRDDTIDKVLADVKALPGHTAFAVAELGSGPPRWIARHNAETQMAIGSGYKLYILGELSRQIAAGTHRWDEVARLGPASLASGVTQKWPKSSPLTVHSLAALMISLSDNTATDTLLDLLGRDKVGEYLKQAGHADPGRALPILKTAEAFSLKMPGAAALRDRWIKGDPAARARLLAEAAPELVIEKVDFAKLGSMPMFIDSIEWFASPADMTGALDTLRRTAGPDALAILAINPGVDPLTAARFDYIGYKGGSEAGVIALNYLVRDKRNRWFVVSGAWNNTERDVDSAKFNGLMVRALALIGR